MPMALIDFCYFVKATLTRMALISNTFIRVGGHEKAVVKMKELRCFLVVIILLEVAGV